MCTFVWNAICYSFQKGKCERARVYDCSTHTIKWNNMVFPSEIDTFTMDIAIKGGSKP